MKNMFYEKSSLDELRCMMRRMKAKNNMCLFLAVAFAFVMLAAVAALIVWKLKCRDEELWLSEDDFEDMYDDEDDDERGCCGGNCDEESSM